MRNSKLEMRKSEEQKTAKKRNLKLEVRSSAGLDARSGAGWKPALPGEQMAEGRLDFRETEGVACGELI
jgi:hypothetical protein